VLSSYDTFTDTDGVPYLSVPLNGRLISMEVMSEDCKNYVDRLSYEQFHAVPTDYEMEQVRGGLTGRARFDSPSHPVYLRVAPIVDGGLCLDLGTIDGRAVVITKAGWQVVATSQVRFRRTPGTTALPVPTEGGSIEELRSFLRGSDAQFMVLVAFILVSLRPEGPYPILELVGEQGSGKSTVTDVVQRLTDPSTITRRSQPRTEQDLAIAARGRWVLAFDNCSHIAEPMSDVFCRLSTGGTFTTRRLYTDTGETVLRFCQPCLLNGIETLARKSDLLDRCWSLEFPALPAGKRRTEVAFWTAFETAAPRLFGVICDGVVRALRDYATVDITPTQRLVDAERWVCAAVTAFGWSPQDMQQALLRHQLASHARALEACPDLWRALQRLAHNGWTGTVSELMQATGQTGSHAAFGNMLRRYRPNFMAFGVDVCPFRQGHESARGYHVSKVVGTVGLVGTDEEV